MLPAQAQVLYEYDAVDQNQLSIKPGEIIEITDDSPELQGWALAKKGDQEGYVPADYVRYIDNKSDVYVDDWKTPGFEQYYMTVLSPEQKLPYCAKLFRDMNDVLYSMALFQIYVYHGQSRIETWSNIKLVIFILISHCRQFNHGCTMFAF